MPRSDESAPVADTTGLFRRATDRCRKGSAADKSPECSSSSADCLLVVTVFGLLNRTARGDLDVEP
jgi:hypothetical protein